MAQQTRTKYLSLRMMPRTDDALRDAAAEQGVTRSRFVRGILVTVLKQREARRHLLGLDRPRKPDP